MDIEDEATLTGKHIISASKAVEKAVKEAVKDVMDTLRNADWEEGYLDNGDYAYSEKDMLETFREIEKKYGI